MKSDSYKTKSIARLVSFLIILSLVFAGTSAFAKMVSVKGDKVNLRKGPGTKYSVKWEYGKGFPLKVISRKGNWMKVKDYENDSGWIHKSLLQSDPQMIVKVNRGQDDKINIRNGPGTKNKIVGKAYYGVVFKTLKRQSGWVKVKHESGLIGWIKENLLWGF